MKYGRYYGYRQTVRVGGGAPVSDWILATGSWSDAGFWRDGEVWID